MHPRIGLYEVVRELGRGGMGVIYVVREPQTGRELALKLILAGRDEAQALARFGREAEALARVRHPGVVRVHQLARAVQGPYLVTELVPGEALDQVLKRGPLEAERAASLVADLADAVAAVHAAGVLHRDLKPGNVIVRPDGVPVLLDFGLARDDGPERLTRTGQLLGTPAYMSPEQADGAWRDVGPASDVYGLGAVLFACLTGGPPFRDGSVHAVVRAVLMDEPRFPREHTPPPALAAICLRALAKAPAERQESAAALREALLSFVAGDAPEPPPRRGLLLGGLAATGLVLLVSAGVAVGLMPGGGAPGPGATHPGGAGDGATAETSTVGSVPGSDEPRTLEGLIAAIGSARSDEREPLEAELLERFPEAEPSAELRARRLARGLGRYRTLRFPGFASVRPQFVPGASDQLVVVVSSELTFETQVWLVSLRRGRDPDRMRVGSFDAARAPMIMDRAAPTLPGDDRVVFAGRRVRLSSVPPTVRLNALDLDLRALKARAFGTWAPGHAPRGGIDPGTWEELRHSVTAVARSPDGEQLAVGFATGSTVVLPWECVLGRRELTFDPPHLEVARPERAFSLVFRGPTVLDVATSRQGSGGTFADAGVTLQRWERQPDGRWTRGLRRRLRLLQGEALVARPGGSDQLLLGVSDPAPGLLLLEGSDFTTRGELADPALPAVHSEAGMEVDLEGAAHGQGVRAVAFSPGGRIVFSGSSFSNPQQRRYMSEVRAWSVEDRAPLGRVTAIDEWALRTDALRLSPDARWLVAGAGAERASGEVGQLLIWSGEDP